jgi:hypothetical protein
MSGRILLVLCGLCAVIHDGASNSLWAQGAYPRVMSPTGHFYGPTQAHYQYERQYGRPWWGGPAPFHPNVGANINIQLPNFFGPGYPVAGYGGPGYYGYPGFYNIVPNPGNFGFQQPQLPYGLGVPPQFSWQQQYQQQLQGGQVAPNPMPPVPAQGWVPPQPGNPGLAGQPGQRGPVITSRQFGPEMPIVSQPHQLLATQPSSLQQKARSVHFQGQGDVWFRQQNFLQAYSRYKQAASAAPDLAAPRFRMAYALIALKRYEVAVAEFVRGIQLDPKYPLIGDSPAKVFGPENQIAAGALVGQVSDWVRQEIRSPDRLFLLGALLRMTGDLNNARICFEAAAQMGGRPAPVMAFLMVDQDPGELARTNPRGIRPNDRPPVPESVEELIRKNSGSVVNPNRIDPNRNGQVLQPVVRPQPQQKLISPPKLQPQLEPQQLTQPGAPGDANLGSDDELDGLPPVPKRAGSSSEPQATPENLPTPVEAQKPKSTAPGFQPIPKKGENAPAGGTQPAGDAKEPDTNGPAIPNPQAGT